jgi:hypothetical protein
MASLVTMPRGSISAAGRIAAHELSHPSANFPSPITKRAATTQVA